MSPELITYLNSFNLQTESATRKQIFTPAHFDEAYDKNTSNDFDWIRCTVYNLLREYESNNLSVLHSEQWCLSHIWQFIDTAVCTKGRDVINAFNGYSISALRYTINLNYICCSYHYWVHTYRGECVKTKVATLELKTTRRKWAPDVTWYLRGNDEIVEYGASKSGNKCDGEGGTECLEESLLKLVLCLKDMLDHLVSMKSGAENRCRKNRFYSFRTHSQNLLLCNCYNHPFIINISILLIIHLRTISLKEGSASWLWLRSNMIGSCKEHSPKKYFLKIFFFFWYSNFALHNKINRNERATTTLSLRLRKGCYPSMSNLYQVEDWRFLFLLTRVLQVQLGNEKNTTIHFWCLLLNKPVPLGPTQASSSSKETE
jgi:hypothetical protein